MTKIYAFAMASLAFSVAACAVDAGTEPAPQPEQEEPVAQAAAAMKAGCSETYYGSANLHWSSTEIWCDGECSGSLVCMASQGCSWYPGSCAFSR